MNICVVGTGYVGLVTGAVFADLGNDVVCVDNDQKKIEALRAGQMPIYEPGLEEMVVRNKDDGRLSFTTDLPGADPPGRRHLHRGGHPPEGHRRDRSLPRGGGRHPDRPLDGPLQGGRQQVHRPGRHRRVRPGSHHAAPAPPHRLRRGLQSRVPARGLRDRGHPPARPDRDRRAQPAGRDDPGGALRPARAAHDHHRPAVGGGDQVRLQRLPGRQDLVHQRDRQHLRERGRRREPGDEGHGPRLAHRDAVPPGRARLRRLLLPQGRGLAHPHRRPASATTSSCCARWWRSTRSGPPTWWT